MNVILGISEVAVGSDLTETQRVIRADHPEIGPGPLDIINDILDFSKVESGKYTIEEREYEMSSPMTLPPLGGGTSGENRVDFMVEAEGSVPALVGDMVRVKQILVNISLKCRQPYQEG